MRMSEWDGIIPAYAGSTLAIVRIRAERRDHPRIRGEHLVSVLICVYV